MKDDNAPKKKTKKSHILRSDFAGASVPQFGYDESISAVAKFGNMIKDHQALRPTEDIVEKMVESKEDDCIQSNEIENDARKRKRGRGRPPKDSEK